MYQIKQLPEDFIVKEISNIKCQKFSTNLRLVAESQCALRKRKISEHAQEPPKSIKGMALRFIPPISDGWFLTILDNGDYLIYLLKKKNYTTEKAVQLIADKLRIKRKFIGYAGNKDKNAITEQLISIKTDRKINVDIDGIDFKFIGHSDKPISLGDLEGNEFEIIVRNLSDNDLKNFNDKIKNNEKILILNYFGEQRFSKNNSEIGKLILKRNFKEAIELIIDNYSKLKIIIDNYLINHKNDYIGALRIIPKKILKLYIHSYQSYIFNKTIKKILNSNRKIETYQNKKIPIIGFGIEFNDTILKKIILELLKKDNISLRDFIIREIPELSSEGSERDLFMEVKELKIMDISDDELNPKKKKIKINFKLDKGCYATIAIKYLFNKL